MVMTETQPATVLQAHGTSGAMGTGNWAGNNTNSNAIGGFSRVFGFNGSTSGGGTRGGLSVLAALLGHMSQDDSTGGTWGNNGAAVRNAENMVTEGVACRDALAHVTLASQLSTQAGHLEQARPKVLLCQAEVARLFGLQPLATASCGLVLDIYQKDLVAEDHALALCQLMTATVERSLSCALPLFRSAAEQLPHAGHLWGHVVGPRLIHALTRAGENRAAAALLFQVAGVVRAVPHGSATYAAQRFRVATNGVRLYHRQMLSAYRSAREAAEQGTRTGTPGDVCSHLLTLTDIHLEAQDPVGALAPCLRCLSAAERSRLLIYRAEALVRLARVKLEMRDLSGALQLAEEVTPQLSASGSARLRGEALMVQADVLLELLARNQDKTDMCIQLLKETVIVLCNAMEEFEAIAELNPLCRCHYLLARVHHQLGDEIHRDKHATRYRQISEFLSGHNHVTWKDLGLPTASATTECAFPMSTRMVPPSPSNHAVAGNVTPFLQSSKAQYEGGGEKQAANEHCSKCPALAQLLLLAEDAQINGAPAANRDGTCGTPSKSVGTGVTAWLHNRLFTNVGNEPHEAAHQHSAKPTVIGNIHALYPMASTLVT